MAEQMEDIKRRIKSINSTERITNAMKLVSASKLRKAKAAYENSKIYLYRLISSIRETCDNTENVPNEFLVGSREIKTKCYVMITSSNGLCGSFNGNVIRVVEEHLSRMKESDRQIRLVTIGSKGKEHFENHGYEILMEHDAPADTVTFQESCDISLPLIEMYKNGEIDEIDIVYTSYINTLRQEVITKKLLPFDIEQMPQKGDYLNEIEYEPSPEDVFDYLVPKYVELTMYGTCIESATCEYAARRTAMENANDNARDMLSQLQMEYNRARQAEITDEIIEIVAGSEAQR